MKRCDQCGWKPPANWRSVRCGSYPFGSCDGTIRQEEEENPRERLDDDGQKYADPRDYRAGRE